MNDNFNDFCEYIRTILNSCCGFIKTDGYMCHFPGTILIMDADEMYFGIIRIPVTHNFYIVAKINTLIGLKTPESQTIENLYFLGNNIKQQTLMRYYDLYVQMEEQNTPIYTETDCYNIDQFKETVSSSEIHHVELIVNGTRYRIPSSKAITALTKSDTASLSIYNWVHDQSNPKVKTIRYTMYKKKFKLTVEIFSNILSV